MSDSRVSMRLLIFLALVLVWPVPMIGLDGSLVPLARFVQLAASLTVLISIEGAGGMVGVLLLLLWGHALIYGVLLFAVSWLISRVVVSLAPRRIAFALVFAAIVGLLVWGSLGHPYDTIFHHSDAHASLLNIYR